MGGLSEDDYKQRPERKQVSDNVPEKKEKEQDGINEILR